MKKVSLVFILILSIALIPCLIEGVRTGDYIIYPGIIASLFLSPAAIAFLLLIETSLNVWIPRGVLALYSMFLIYTGVSALGAELHGPLFGYWLLPATMIFIPAIFTLPNIPFYKNQTPNKAQQSNPLAAP